VISHSTRDFSDHADKCRGATYQTSALSAAALWKQALSQSAFPSPPCLAITIIRTGMTFATIGFYSGRHWPKLGGKLKKNEKENKVKLWT
jgi:hypothetical protein